MNNNHGRSAQKDRYGVPSKTADFLARGKFCRGPTCVSEFHKRDGLFKTHESFPAGSDVCQTCLNDMPAVLPPEKPVKPVVKPAAKPPPMAKPAPASPTKPDKTPPPIAKPSAQIGNLRRAALKTRICHGPCGKPFVQCGKRYAKCPKCRNADRRAKRSRQRAAANALKPPPRPLETPKPAPMAIRPPDAPTMKIGGLARMVAEEVAKQIGPAVAAYFARLGAK